MNVTIPDALKPFVERQVRSGHYPNPDAFVAELVRTEAEMFERVGRGESLRSSGQWRGTRGAGRGSGRALIELPSRKFFRSWAKASAVA